MTRIYNEGLTVKESEIEDFIQELAMLESHWAYESIDESELRRLKERMGFVREAVDVALSHDGVVDIS